MNIEINPIATGLGTGVIGAVVGERDKHAWRGELLINGGPGRITKDGREVTVYPRWLERQMMNAAAMIISQYPR